MLRWKSNVPKALCALLLLGATGGWAQDPKAVGAAPEDVEKKIAAEVKAEEQGWHKKLSLGGTFTFNHSDKVVGTQDGTNLQLGLVLDGSLVWKQGPHEWENVLKLQHARSKSPAFDTFAKSLDNFDIQSTYLYHLANPAWLGPYARVRLNTALFKGYELRNEETDVIRIHSDGTEENESYAAQEKIPLTNGFEPLLIAENVGLFANPASRDDFKAKLKLGLGAQHVLVKDGFSLKDKDGTPELELVELEGATQGGAVLEANFSGTLSQNVLWKADANLFMEAFSSSDVDVSKVNFEFAGGVSVKLAKWMSLDYILNLKRVPIILDEWQVQNGVVITTGFNLI